MATVVISPANVATYPEGGGHFWVHMQYVQGLLELGCDVYWLERFRRSHDERRDRETIELFLDRMRCFGMEGKVILYSTLDAPGDGELPYDFLTTSRAAAEAVIDRADLLLNSYYAIELALLNRFRCTAVLDIDPGLLQFWVSCGQLTLPAHDLYFTTGETVGTALARFGDCGVNWLHIRPPICLSRWPYVSGPSCDAMTTVSGWWGGEGKGEWVTDGDGVLFENNKRVTFMQFLDLPRRTPQVLELALCLGDGDPPEREQFQQRGHHWNQHHPCPKDVTQYESDAKDRAILEHFGWRVRSSTEAAGTPQRYQRYISQSRGEFSCAKPSCMYFQNAWVSDRTICYLASGKPAIVQDTGPSEYLPNGEGMFRFSTLEQAEEAIHQVNADYSSQCRAARELAEAYFDARPVLEGMLNEALRSPLKRPDVLQLASGREASS